MMHCQKALSCKQFHSFGKKGFRLEFAGALEQKLKEKKQKRKVPKQQDNEFQSRAHSAPIFPRSSPYSFVFEFETVFDDPQKRGK